MPSSRYTLRSRPPAARNASGEGAAKPFRRCQRQRQVVRRSAHPLGRHPRKQDGVQSRGCGLGRADDEQGSGKDGEDGKLTPEEKEAWVEALKVVWKEIGIMSDDDDCDDECRSKRADEKVGDSAHEDDDDEDDKDWSERADEKLGDSAREDDDHAGGAAPPAKRLRVDGPSYSLGSHATSASAPAAASPERRSGSGEDAESHKVLIRAEGRRRVLEARAKEIDARTKEIDARTLRDNLDKSMQILKEKWLSGKAKMSMLRSLGLDDLADCVEPEAASGQS